MGTQLYLREISLKRDAIEGYDRYPFNIPAVRELDALQFNAPVTFLMGENGSGKSTLLEAIAVALGFNAEGGSVNFQFNTRSSHSGLSQFLRIVRGRHRPKDGFFLRAESFYNVATNIEALDSEPSFGPAVIESYGGLSLHEQSHGESFLALMLHRFGGQGLYILDEPEAALSPTRQLAVLSRMHQLVNDNSQFIIATHAPILMAYPDATIFSLDDTGFFEIEFTETGHYTLTKTFLDEPSRMLRGLLNQDGDDT